MTLLNDTDVISNDEDHFLYTRIPEDKISFSSDTLPDEISLLLLYQEMIEIPRLLLLLMYKTIQTFLHTVHKSYHSMIYHFLSKKFRSILFNSFDLQTI